MQYYLKNALSGDCVDVAGDPADGSDQLVGAALTLFPCSPDNDHQWVFQEA